MIPLHFPYPMTHPPSPLVIVAALFANKLKINGGSQASPHESQIANPLK